jgi:hypothetical protein
MCTICQLSDSYEKTPQGVEINVTTLECGHKFHLTCLLNCIATNTKTCPLCRHTYLRPLEERWLDERRRKTLVDIIRTVVYACCFCALLFTFGGELSFQHVFEFYAPHSSRVNLTLGQQVRDGSGLFGLLYNAGRDLILLQLQTVMYRVYLALIVVIRVINFFIPVMG